MCKKAICIIVGITTMSLGSNAMQVNWSSGDLSGAATLSAGWLVQLYQDVSGNNSGSWYNSISIDNSGTVLSSTDGTANDSKLSSFVTLSNPFGSVINFSTSTNAPDNAYVYTVIFNSSSMASATKFIIADSMSHNVGAGSPPGPPNAYSIGTTIAGNWQNVQAIPEPATFMLFGIGGFGAWLVRRNKLNSKYGADA